MIARRAVLAAMGGAAVAPLVVSTSFAVEGVAEPVRVITSETSLTHSLFNVMRSHGALAKYGVTIQTQFVADASRTIPAVLGGSADLCVLNGVGLAIAVIAKGAAMKIVGANCPLVPDAVYTGNPAIQHVKDLEGHTVGIGALGALTHQLIVALMQKKGADVSKVIFRNVGSAADSFRAIAARTVDAGAVAVDVADLKDQYGLRSLPDGNMWIELPDYVFQGAFASDHAIATKRQGLVRVMAAFAESFRFLQSPAAKDAYFQARKAATGRDDPKAAGEFWTYIQTYHPYSVDMQISAARLLYMQKLNIDTGTQKAVVPPERIIDMSLAQEASNLIQA